MRPLRLYKTFLLYINKIQFTAYLDCGWVYTQVNWNVNEKWNYFTSRTGGGLGVVSSPPSPYILSSSMLHRLALLSFFLMVSRWFGIKPTTKLTRSQNPGFFSPSEYVAMKNWRRYIVFANIFGKLCLLNVREFQLWLLLLTFSSHDIKNVPSPTLFPLGVES